MGRLAPCRSPMDEPWNSVKTFRSLRTEM